VPVPKPNNKPGYSVSRSKKSFKVVHYDNRGNVEWQSNYDVTMIDWDQTKKETTKTTVNHDNGFPFRPPTDYTRQINRCYYTPGKRTEVGLDGSSETITGIYLPGVDDPTDFIGPGFDGMHDFNSDEANQCIAEALLKLQDSKVQIGQFIAEAKSSAEMLAGSSESLLRALLAVKRGRFREVPKALGLSAKSATNGYLAWEYGWKPLCSDLYGMYEDLKSKTKDRRLFMRGASRTIRTPVIRDYTNGEYASKIRVNGHRIDQCTVYATPSVGFLQDANAYGLVNPLSLAWEVVPYSFVVDWFMPIGNTLSSLSASAGLDFMGAYSVAQQEGEVIFTGGAGSCTKKYSYMSRSNYGDFPRAGFYAVRNPLNLHKSVNLFNLLAQLL